MLFYVTVPIQNRTHLNKFTSSYFRFNLMVNLSQLFYITGAMQNRTHLNKFTSSYFKFNLMLNLPQLK